MHVLWSLVCLLIVFYLRISKVALLINYELLNRKRRKRRISYFIGLWTLLLFVQLGEWNGI